jgi:putative ABC transport system permease protein
VAAVAATAATSATLQNGSTNWTTSVVGTSPSWLSVRARKLTSGRFLSTPDDQSVAAVTVLGSSSATELFGPIDPVGQSVTVDGKPFQVIGVRPRPGRPARPTTTTRRSSR